MKRCLSTFVAAWLLIVPTVGYAQSDAACLHRHQVEVVLPGVDGRVRLPLDPSVVTSAGLDLADLRVVDDLRQEIPFGVLLGAPATSPGTPTAVVIPREAHRSRLPGSPTTFVESFDLPLPAVPLPREGWTMELDVEFPVFSAELTVEAATGRRTATLTRTVFRMRDGSEQTRIAIPRELGNVVRVELRGQDGFLSPSFRFVPGTPESPPELATMPLDAAALARVSDRPTLVFDTYGAVARGGFIRLYFGGGRARPPAYATADDLVGATSMDLPITSHGPVDANPAECSAPVLSYARHPGAEVDPRAYRLRARVDIPASAEGIVRLALPASIVGEARPGLADVRLVDANGRQWPYVIEPTEAATAVSLLARREASPPRRSVFRVTRQVGALGTAALLVDPHARLVDRAIVVEDLTSPHAPVVLARTRLVRLPGTEEGPIEVPLRPSSATILRVTIDDGDEARLAPTFAIPFEQPVLYTVAPAGRYVLLFSAHATSRDIEQPRYELEHARTLVLAVRPVDAAMAPVEPNPESAPPSAFSRHRTADVLLWAVLIVASIALVGLTFRLSRSL